MNDLMNYVFFDLYRFSTRRGLFCLWRVRERLVGFGGFDATVATVDRAIAHHEATKRLEGVYDAASRSRHGPEAMELDRELTRALSAIDDALGAAIKGLGLESPRGKRANEVRGALFPRGIGQVANLAFVEKDAEVRSMLERMDAEPELTQSLRQFAAMEIVDRVAELHERFSEAVQVPRVSFAEVRDARLAGQDLLCRVAVELLYHRGADGVTADEVEVLNAALGEVVAQNQAIRRLRRRRNLPPDEELDDDDGFADGEAGVPPVAQPLNPPKADDADVA